MKSIEVALESFLDNLWPISVAVLVVSLLWVTGSLERQVHRAQLDLIEARSKLVVCLQICGSETRSAK